MNDKPHTHNVKIDSQNYGALWPTWAVLYGDTQVYVHRGPWFARRLIRGVRKAIRLHDYGSIVAGKEAKELLRLTKLAEVEVQQASTWTD